MLNMEKIEKKIDLHVHSTWSDGSFSPSELAEEARRKGLSAFALTDHETVYGDEEAETAARKLGIGFLPGIELSMAFEGRKLHVICLGFDREHEAFQRVFKKARAIREARIPEIIAMVQEKGIDISMEKVKPFAFGKPLDRFAVMRYMGSLHLYEKLQPIWDNYLTPAAESLGISGDVAAEEALPAIREAGGITSLAHFHKKIGLHGMERADQEQAICRLIALGLDGMEQRYPNYSEQDAAFADYMIEKYRMLPTAGTDFHGKNRLAVEMGTGVDGNMAIPYAFFEQIAGKCKKFVLPQGF